MMSSAAKGHVITPAVRTFTLDVAVREKDAAIFEARSGVYEIIGNRLAELIDVGLSVSIDDFFGWAICQKLSDLDGRRTRKELASQATDLKKHALHDLGMDQQLLRFATEPSPGIVEYIGVGAGLSLIDALFALDASYFRRIPQTSKRKTLDFEGCYRAPTPAAYVRVEVRGRTDGGGAKAAWEEIDKKKKMFGDVAAQKRPSDAPLPLGTPTHLFGTVAEIPRKKQGTTRVVIGDPPIPAFDGDPRRARLLERLRFYQRALSAFQPRGALLIALSERIGIIEPAADDWPKYDKIRLTNWRMEKWKLGFNIAQAVRVNGDDQVHGRSTFTLKSSRLLKKNVEPLKREGDLFFFIGLHRDVLLALAKQDFDEIADRRYDKRYLKAEIDGRDRTLFQLPSGLVISSLVDDVAK